MYIPILFQGNIYFNIIGSPKWKTLSTNVLIECEASAYFAQKKLLDKQIAKVCKKWNVSKITE